MTDVQDRRVYVSGVIAVLILLWLLWGRGSATNIDRRVQRPGDVNVSPSVNTYEIPALSVPGDDFDWMQTSNLGCDCTPVKLPQWEAPETVLVAYPVFRYASVSEYAPTPIHAEFAIFQPPPPPTWWFDVLLDVDNVAKSLRRTSTGEWFRLGKYGTFRTDTHRYTEYTISGPDLYWGTGRFVHDASRDKYPPAPSPQPTYSATYRT